MNVLYIFYFLLSPIIFLLLIPGVLFSKKIRERFFSINSTIKNLASQISENNGQYSATTVWSYTLPDNLYGALSGNVQKLENGNYLINTIGNESGAYSVEVTENHEIAWMSKYNLGNYQTGPLYRAMRIPDIKIIVVISIVFLNVWFYIFRMSKSRMNDFN